MKKFILLLMVCFASSGCSNLMRIHPGGEDILPPPGPKIYQQGFMDGCESGSSGYKSSLKSTINSSDIVVVHIFIYDI